VPIVCCFLESPSMHGVCRLLWSLIILASFGCQSMPSGSTNVAGGLSEDPGASAKPSAKPEGLAALIASRFDAGSKQRQQAEASPVAEPRAQDKVQQIGGGKQPDVITSADHELQRQRLKHP